MAIADGRARGGVRDLAGWVVSLLRQRRDHGWTPPPPAPRADAPGVLGAYFAQQAAEQEREREAAQADESAAPSPAEILPTLSPPPPQPDAAQPPSLAQVWQDTLVGLRLRLPREVYQTCMRQTTLICYADGLATIGISDMRLKEHLEHSYFAALRLALSDALGREVMVRVASGTLA